MIVHQPRHCLLNWMKFKIAVTVCFIVVCPDFNLSSMHNLVIMASCLLSFDNINVSTRIIGEEQFGWTLDVCVCCVLCIIYYE